MNVRVLTFPDGEDPDCFAKRVSSDELAKYLKEESKDFISFKVSLLMKEAAQDPIKKAGLIRDIVKSIAKIPDAIKREVYVQDCSRIMDISEGVLFNELAQLINKEQNTPSKNRSFQKEKPSGSLSGNMMPIGGALYDNESPYGPPNESKPPKINVLDIYEREVIKLLLMYGNEEVDFIDWVNETDKKGRVKLVAQHYSNKVCRELYLQLQDDEMEFANPVFSEIYYLLIDQFNQKEQIVPEELVNLSRGELSKVVTDILMEDERYVLNDWKKQEIHVPPKTDKLAKAVPDAVMNLRRVLIQEKIVDLTKNIESSVERDQNLEKIMQYTSLKNKIYDKLNRVI
jgi:DNA primase